MQHFDFNNPVCILTGEEFLPKPGMTFAKQILEFFQSQGGLAHSPWGEVLLDMKGIQSDKSHGIGRIKAASFAAIKDVLEKGSVILPLDYYATNGEVERTWYCGYQVSLINLDGSWKIAQMTVDQELNAARAESGN